jgi:hypothetical protein
MKYFRSHCRSFLITFGISFGGLILCGIVAIALFHLFDPESQFIQICLCLLILPAPISILLGLGLGYCALREVCSRSVENHNRSEPAGDGKPDPVSR